MKLSSALDPNFKASLRKLLLATTPIAVAFKLKKICAKIDEEISTYYQVKNETLSKIVEIDEKGRYKLNEKDEVIFKSEEEKTNFIAEHAKLFDISFELPPKIKSQELGKSMDNTLNSLDIILLEDILEE